MRCESFLDRYDRLDADEEPGVLLRLHLAACPECRAKVALLKEASASYLAAVSASDSAGPIGDLVEDRIMVAVRLLPKPKRELHARDWAVSGFVLVASVAIIPFDPNFSLIKELFGTSYSLSLALVLASTLTVFGGVFIATHIDELEPILKRYMPHA